MPLVLAHGFVPSLWEVLLVLAAVAAICLALGVSTAAILYRKTGRRRIWWFAPAFAAGWGALIIAVAEGPSFLIHQVWSAWDWTVDVFLDLAVNLLD